MQKLLEQQMPQRMRRSNHLWELCTYRRRNQTRQPPGRRSGNREQTVLDRLHIFVVCVFHDHSITTQPCCALCLLSTPNSALYVSL
jgi:hypothetical protein